MDVKPFRYTLTLAEISKCMGNTRISGANAGSSVFAAMCRFKFVDAGVGGKHNKKRSAIRTSIYNDRGFSTVCNTKCLISCDEM